MFYSVVDENTKNNSCRIMQQDNCSVVLHPFTETTKDSRSQEIAFCWQCIQLNKRNWYCSL